MEHSCRPAHKRVTLPASATGALHESQSLFVVSWCGFIDLWNPSCGRFRHVDLRATSPILLGWMHHHIRASGFVGHKVQDIKLPAFEV